MTTFFSSDERCGREILRIFRSFKTEPTGILQIASLLDHWHGFADDFACGLHWCMAQGFIQLEEIPPNIYRLTKAGYELLNPATAESA